MLFVKRIVYILLLLAALLCGCGGKESLASYTAADAQALLDAGVCSGEMEKVDAYVAAMLYGVEEEQITDCACYLALDTSVSADELSVLVLADEAAARAAEEGAHRRVESQIESCALYCPDQVPRLEGAVILRRGNTVLLAVGDGEKLSRALEELGLGEG